MNDEKQAKKVRDRYVQIRIGENRLGWYQY